MAEISGRKMVVESFTSDGCRKPSFDRRGVSCLLNIGGRLQREGQPVKVMYIKLGSADEPAEGKEMSIKPAM